MPGSESPSPNTWTVKRGAAEDGSTTVGIRCHAGEGQVLRSVPAASIQDWPTRRHGVPAGPRAEWSAIAENLGLVRFVWPPAGSPHGHSGLIQWFRAGRPWALFHGRQQPLTPGCRQWPLRLAQRSSSTDIYGKSRTAADRLTVGTPNYCKEHHGFDYRSKPLISDLAFWENRQAVRG